MYYLSGTVIAGKLRTDAFAYAAVVAERTLRVHCTLTRWQHFSVWNDNLAPSRKYDIKLKVHCHSMHIYSKNIPMKFHPCPIFSVFWRVLPQRQ